MGRERKREGKEEREEEREEEGERGEGRDLLFHLVMHSLVASRMCPDWGWNPPPWHIKITLQPTDLHGQGHLSF